MSTLASSNSINGYPGERSWVPVSELTAAVDAGFLTKEEARTVVWSQLPVLQRQAANTPPAVA